jgi:hypothetical protein
MSPRLTAEYAFREERVAQGRGGGCWANMTSNRGRIEGQLCAGQQAGDCVFFFFFFFPSSQGSNGERTYPSHSEANFSGTRTASYLRSSTCWHAQTAAHNANNPGRSSQRRRIRRWALEPPGGSTILESGFTSTMGLFFFLSTSSGI